MKNLIALLSLLLSLSLMAQDNATIKNILDNPGKYMNEIVEIRGSVIQYIPASTSSTAYYIIIDDFGKDIKVQAMKAGAPETMKKYKVKGYLNEIHNEYIVQETSRESLETVAQTPPSEAKKTTPAELDRIRLEEQRLQADLERQKRNDTMLYVIIGIAVLLVIVIIIAFASKKKEAPQYPNTGRYNDSGPATQPVTIRNPSPETIVSKTIASEGFSTIRFESAPKTMRFIPGKFTITSQEDKGKSFQIAGYPSGGDAIVTIGREEVRGERSYAHIKLDDKFKTVSRKQAELVYSNKTLWVINRSEANYTQVDGYELKPGEKKEVQNGSSIRMGELEFKYSI